MSSRTYNLRTRQEIAPLRSIVPAPVSNRSHVSTESTRDAPPHVPSLVLDSDSPQALYSDVVASRPPSPRRETEAQVAPSMISHPIGRELVQSLVPGINNSPASSEEDEPPIVKEKISEWTTVNRRRARSLGSAANDSRPLEKGGLTSNRELTEEQSQAVRAATTNMTTPQRDVLHRRQKKVHMQQRSPTPSRKEGTSRQKGLGIDPREWGNVNISRESLDLEAQATALESIAQQHRANNG